MIGQLQVQGCIEDTSESDQFDLRKKLKVKVTGDPLVRRFRGGVHEVLSVDDLVPIAVRWNGSISIVIPARFDGFFSDGHSQQLRSDHRLNDAGFYSTP